MMLRKAAIFVEGQTEAIFVRHLLSELAGRNEIFFDVKDFGRHRNAVLTNEPVANNEQRFFVLIFDCRGDDNVKTVIRDRAASLDGAGYELILGLRDLYPTPIAQVSKVEAALAVGLPVLKARLHIVLAIAEVEAWFLQNAAHYSLVDPRLDVANFKNDFNFDPAIDSAETIEDPANFLGKIYKSVGKAYKKKYAYVNRTVRNLCIAEMSVDGARLSPNLGRFIGYLDFFLARKEP